MARREPKKIGQNIRQARLRCGLTQLALARKIGLNGKGAESLISRYENNKWTPEISTIMRLAEALSVTLNELVLAEQPCETGK